MRKHYEDWVNNAETRPVISPDIFKRYVFPRLSKGRKVFLLVLDNFRFDQWRMLSQELVEDYDIAYGYAIRTQRFVRRTNAGTNQKDVSRTLG